MLPMNPILTLLSPAGPKARLNVFIFHRVLAQPDPLFPEEMHADRFREICGWVKSWFNVLPLDQAVAHLKASTLPARAACITFDDGYADNYHVALPILQQQGLTATVFISTGFLDGGCMWNDVVIEAVRLTPLFQLQLGELLGPDCSHLPVASSVDKQLAIQTIIGQLKYKPLAVRSVVAAQIALQAQTPVPTDLMMTSDDARNLRRAGMQIGAHTVSHPILANLDRATARSEIAESKYAIENLLGERVGLFAYPNGKPGIDYTSESVEIVRELGFDAAFSTHQAAARMGTDVFQIPRFTPWDKTSLRFCTRVAANLFQADHVV